LFGYAFQPNDITFISVITACSYLGMPLKGLQIFNRMTTVYGIQPKSEHYGCRVDFLSRAGLFEEAKGVAAERLFELERHSGAYVLLSNMYAADGRYDNAKRIRKIMKDRGVEKTPGCSSIDLNGLVHEFIAGEETHPQMEDIYQVLEKMNTLLDS
ncbi:hypothetical protein IFM89_034452, partial [Coptis chinensis]